MLWQPSLCEFAQSAPKGLEFEKGVEFEKDPLSVFGTLRTDFLIRSRTSQDPLGFKTTRSEAFAQAGSQFFVLLKDGCEIVFCDLPHRTVGGGCDGCSPRFAGQERHFPEVIVFSKRGYGF